MHGEEDIEVTKGKYDITRKDLPKVGKELSELNGKFSGRSETKRPYQL